MLEGLREERDRHGDMALASILHLQTNLEHQKALEGEPVRPTDMTPNHQLLNEVVEHGSAFRASWNAVGLIERSR